MQIPPIGSWLVQHNPTAAIGAAATPVFPQRGVRLFWRTFFFLAVLLLGSLVAWLQIFKLLESEPQAVQDAQQLASLVNLSRESLRYSDAIARVSLIKTLADQEGLRVVSRHTNDSFTAFPKDRLNQRITQALNSRLGPGTVVAQSVNGEAGFWVGFAIEEDAYWLQADEARLGPSRKSTWAWWLGTAGLLSLLGAAFMAGLLNRPLKQLSLAASRLRDGQFDPRLLDEAATTREIRELNIGFNRMAAQLSKMDHDRTLMLAGISHDLRTPLARLRLETEMSVSDESARAHMAADISQLDAIIDKFLDYARPHSARLNKLSLDRVLADVAFAVADYDDLRLTLNLPPDVVVLADAVELRRALSNLLENARRYGKSPGTGCAQVDITVRVQDPWVGITLSDQGPGVPTDLLKKITRPFFRVDPSRAGPTGAGLGLAIVEGAIERMGGGLTLSNRPGGGLVAQIRLKRG